jgi:hypothetical protein
MHWAIDFGACLLIERLARGAIEPQLRLPVNHFLAGEPTVVPSVRAAAEAIDAANLRSVLELVPAPWLEDLGLARQKLLDRLLAYLDALRAT